MKFNFQYIFFIFITISSCSFFENKISSININSPSFNILQKKISFETSMKSNAFITYWITGSDSIYYSSNSLNNLSHEISNKNIAYQIFLESGPIAFLPIGEKEFSMVVSVNNNKINKSIFEKDNIVNFINKITNKKFGKIKLTSDLISFDLYGFNLESYRYGNIIFVGDSAHSIHPLAGQGFNMTLRDINFLSDIIENKLNLGLPIDSSIFEEFELKTKHLNYVFSFGVDFIYEFFKFTNEKKNTQKIFKIFNKNNLLKKYIIQLADKGI